MRKLSGRQPTCVDSCTRNALCRSRVANPGNKMLFLVHFEPICLAIIRQHKILIQNTLDETVDVRGETATNERETVIYSLIATIFHEILAIPDYFVISLNINRDCNIDEAFPGLHESLFF